VKKSAPSFQVGLTFSREKAASLRDFLRHNEKFGEQMFVPQLLAVQA
jgi:hypothetical protein